MIRCSILIPTPMTSRQLAQLLGKIVLQPNHSLSWRALKYFLAFMMLLSFGIAHPFMFFGYWLVLPFTGLEMAALAYCLWLCLRRGSLQEVITFSADEVRLKRNVDSPDNTETWERFYQDSRHRSHPPLVS